MSKAWINSQKVNTGSVNFKNKIINGDFSVNQRKNTIIDNEEDYPIDRVCVDVVNSSVAGTTEDIYSPNEGSLVSSTDPFGDGSLVAKYELDSNANDTTGNYDGTTTDVTYTAGKFDKAGVFNGDTSKLETSLDISNEKYFTISFFGNLKDSQVDYTPVIMQSQDDKREGIRITHGSGVKHPNIWNADKGDNSEFSDASDWSDFVGVMTHYCFVIADTKATFFINGESKETIDIGGNLKLQSCNIYNYNDNSTINGIIDQVEIYNKALTEDEIKKLYVESLDYIQKKHYKCEVLTKDSNANINPYIYKFEGQDILGSVFDDMTLSFDFFSNVTGSYNVKLVTECLDGTQETFSTTFDYSGSDFNKIVINVPKGTFTKSPVNDERLGTTLYIASDADSNLNVSDWIRLANVQLESGSVNTEFEVLPYNTQLLSCKRYFKYSSSDAYDNLVSNMRSTPAITGSGPYIFDSEL